MLIPFEQLFSRYRIRTTGVLHLGANLAQEAEAYRQQGIRDVVWVEALPDLCATLAQELKLYPGNRVLCACVSDVDGQEVTFHIANNGAQSSSFLELGTHAQEHPTVRYVRDLRMKTWRVDTLLAEQGISVGPDWFLNADLQGAELPALKGMGDLLHQFKYAYVEVNARELYKGCALVDEVDKYLAEYGFVAKEIKMTGSGWGDKFYMKG